MVAVDADDRCGGQFGGGAIQLYLARASLCVRFPHALVNMTTTVHSEFNGLVDINVSGYHYGLTNAASWYFGPCDVVSVGAVSWTNQGAAFQFVQVDSGGHMAVTAADVYGVAQLGFVAAFGSVGMILFIRWLARTFLGAARIRTNYD